MFPAGVLQDGAAVLLRERQHGEILGDGKGQWLKVHIHLPKGRMQNAGENNTQNTPSSLGRSNSKDCFFIIKSLAK